MALVGCSLLGGRGGHQVPATSVMPAAVWDRHTWPRRALSSATRAHVSCCPLVRADPQCQNHMGKGLEVVGGNAGVGGTQGPGAKGRSGRSSSRPRWCSREILRGRLVILVLLGGLDGRGTQVLERLQGGREGLLGAVRAACAQATLSAPGATSRGAACKPHPHRGKTRRM